MSAANSLSLPPYWPTRIFTAQVIAYALSQSAIARYNPIIQQRKGPP